MKPADPRTGTLLRWYPRAWRERYGEEFLALIQDTLDGRRPTWRLRLSVAGAGLRERAHQAVRTGKQAVNSQTVVMRWLGSLLAGSALAAIPDYLRESPPSARAWQTAAAFDTFLAILALTGAAVLAGGLAALPAVLRFLRAGGWPKIRRRVAWAAGASVVAGGGLAYLVVVSDSRSFSQLSTWGGYWLGFGATSLALVITIGLWAAAASALAGNLRLAARVRTAETVLSSVILIAVLLMAPVQGIWLSAAQGSVTSLPLALIGVAATGGVAWVRCRRAKGRHAAPVASRGH